MHLLAGEFRIELDKVQYVVYLNYEKVMDFYILTDDLIQMPLEDKQIKLELEEFVVKFLKSRKKKKKKPKKIKHPIDLLTDFD